MSVRLAPSILAADFARLGQQVVEAEQAGADRIHVDVMDGHFVPNLSMGAPIVASLRRVTRLPLEVHLMISNPDMFLDEFVEDQDYCDLTRERWIWSIGKHKVSGQILASTDVVYKDNSQYDLLWLR